MENNHLVVQAWAKTDKGLVREQNEDNYILALGIPFFAVADGMGGHAGGGIASLIAVDTLESELKRALPFQKNDLLGLSKKVMLDANRAIYERGLKEEGLRGMGTTATTLLIEKKNAFITHVGDSRAYLIRAQEIIQLTEDHSMVGDQLKAGLITPLQARQSPFRHVITRSLGFAENLDIDLLHVEIQTGDTFLLCTDGLTSFLIDNEIRDILHTYPHSQTPQVLIDMANQRGGDDNSTVVVIHIEF